MKKLFFCILGILFSLSAIAQTIGDAFYIYRNDGQFNAFFREEIDSITYSCYDLDSIYSNDYVTQVIYTQDSIYRIPLEAIDSVGFVTPKTTYQPGVIVLEGEMNNYILSSDSMSISFIKDIPSQMLPRVGDKLVTDQISDVFPAGFAGKVESIEVENESFLLKCTKVDLNDVYEYYYYTTQSSVSSVKQRAYGPVVEEHSWERAYYLNTIRFPLTNYITPHITPRPLDEGANDFAFRVENDQEVDVTPTYRVRCVRVITPNLGSFVSIDVSQEYKVHTAMFMSGEIKWSHEFLNTTIPLVGIPFLHLYVSVGPFIDANAKITMEDQLTQTYRQSFHFEGNSRSMFDTRMSLNGFHLENEQHNGLCMIDGEMSLGIYGEFGVAFADRNIASVAYRGEIGATIGGNTMIYQRDVENALHSTNLYNRLKESGIYFKGFYRTGLPVKLLWFGWDNPDYEQEWEFARFCLVPQFSETKLYRGENISKLYANVKVNGTYLPVLDMGFTLFEGEEDTEGATQYIPWYEIPNHDTTHYYHSEFNIQSPLNNFKVYPTLRIMDTGIEMLAEPYTEVACIEVETSSVSGLGQSRATLWGKLTPAILQCKESIGIIYGTQKGTLLTEGTLKTIEMTTIEDGSFYVPIIDLQESTTYYYVAFFQDSNGKLHYGNVKSFTTKGMKDDYPFDPLSLVGSKWVSTSRVLAEAYENAGGGNWWSFPECINYYTITGLKSISGDIATYEGFPLSINIKTGLVSGTLWGGFMNQYWLSIEESFFSNYMNFHWNQDPVYDAGLAFWTGKGYITLERIE